jgi:ribosomal protein S6
MNNIYETIFFIKSNVKIEQINFFIKDICKLELTYKSKNLYIKTIENKKLSWILKKQNFATLIYHKYICDPLFVKHYNNYLKMIDCCLLKQVILIKKNVNIDSFKEIDKNVHEVFTTINNDNFENILNES